MVIVFHWHHHLYYVNFIEENDVSWHLLLKGRRNMSEIVIMESLKLR